MKNTKPTLPNTEKLLAIRDELGIDADNETVLALAERAVARGDNPPALFRWMLMHPESWTWLIEQDRARARQRLDNRTPAKLTTCRKTYAEWRAERLGRPQRTFGPPPASTGWQEEAKLIAQKHDERLTHEAQRERWGRAVALATLGSMLVWLFW